MRTNSINRFYSNPTKQRSLAASHQSPTADNVPRFKFNIIGTGMIGREHMRVVALLGQAQIHGMFDVEESSLNDAENAHSSYSDGPLIRYSTLEAACLEPCIDALLICTPNFTHFDILQAAMKSGKAIFLEKPMATNLAEAAQIVKLSNQYSSFIQLGMQYRYKPQYSEAFYQVKSQGAIGDVKTISMSEYRPPFLDKVKQWNKFNANSGGTLVEKCCHYFDLINLMAQSAPVQVFASGGQAVNFVGFEYDGQQSDIADHAFVIVDFANGVRANFTLNMFCTELKEELIVCGVKGSVTATETSSFEADRPSIANVNLENNAEKGVQKKVVTYAPLIEQSGHHGATFFEHIALIERLDGVDTDSATPEQGLWSLIVASAAQESIERKSVVVIEDYLRETGLGEYIK